MEYIEEVGKYIIQADEYLKSLLFKISPLYRKEHGYNQDVTVPLFTTLHSTSESILILLLNQSIFDADVLLRTVMEGTNEPPRGKPSSTVLGSYVAAHSTCLLHLLTHL